MNKIPVRKTISKIQVEGSRQYYLLTTLHDDGETGFDLSLTDGVSAWKANVSEDDMDNTSSKIKMKFEDYVSQTRKAFTREQIGTFNFQYQLKKTSGSTQFIWKKHIPDENIKFQLGSTKLEEIKEASSLIQTMFDSSIGVINELQEKIYSLESDNQRLATERSNALKRLEKCVTAKENLENDLYSKFATVINDKKSRIRSLKDQITNGTSTKTKKAEPSSSRQQTKETVETTKNIDSDVTDDMDSSEREYNTDEEQDTPPKKKSKATVAVKTPPSLDGASLLLGEEDQDELVPATGRRRRRGGATLTKKQTPAKPVIPRTPSSTSSSSGDRRRSVRKSTSKTSDRSMDVENTDDLLDEL